MRISERGQVTIPKAIRHRLGMNHNVEVEMIPTQDGLLIRKTNSAEHPVDRVYGVLNDKRRSDDHIDEIRGR
ncbi:MAG: AbrB/MazE/SpoVT family DNA-binding domain-containing protein [Gammaproteobacteria bacterium]|nr:AbrB/MazE/SpoVT family DNA-binding domain-containing protein [Gammaproteobacteria bacterium]